MDHPIVYPAMGLSNEVGEFLGKLKKIFRDQKGKFTERDKESLRDELGDVLWYFTQVCTELGLTLEEVGKSNLDKLFSRLERDKINGSGDKR
ncbi:MAG: nucleoside triphosphate pyrophosphohydrolase family protein [bacterium]|nr:nucleoside triphosphate pyrophosphohydrolase family protein [bacterium]